MDNIFIAGKKLKLENPASEITKNLWLGLLADFEVYQFVQNGRPLLLLTANESGKFAPLQLAKIAQRIERTVHLSAVFYFERLHTYERDRLVDRGVYFVVSDKFAFVPTLLANRRLSNNEMPTYLLPSTQYLLLFHLQCHSLDDMTIKDISKITPYKYVTIAKSLQQLVVLKLIELNADNDRTKRVKVDADNRKLWNKAQPYLTNPIKHSGYITEHFNYGKIGGIDALSHYSMLVGEKIPTRVIATDESKTLRLALSRFEDEQRVEIWKYPPVSTGDYVDRLSLYLTLKDDGDPRVEKELETMINEMQW